MELRKRKFGTGTVFFLKRRNKYMASYYNPIGKRISRTFDTKEEAQLFLEKQLYLLSNNKYTEDPDVKITLAKWLTHFLITYKKPMVSIQTYRGYVEAVARMEPILDLPLKSFNNVFAIQDFFNSLRKQYSISTISIMKSVLCQAIHKAYTLRVIAYDYSKQVELLPQRRKKHIVKIFSINELQQLEAFYKDLYDQRSMMAQHYIIFMIGLYTGMRASEILALAWSDIDLNIGEIYVHKTLVSDAHKTILQDVPKSMSGIRKIRIPNLLLDLLKEYFLIWKEKGFEISALFQSPRLRNQFMSLRAVDRLFLIACKACNIKGRTFHSLRHTYASYLLLRNVPISVVSHTLGHSSSTITLNIYSHFIDGSDPMVAQVAEMMYDSQVLPIPQSS